MKSKKTRDCIERLAKENNLTQGQVFDIIKSNYMFAYQKVSNSENTKLGKFPTVPLVGFGKFFSSERLTKLWKIYTKNKRDESISTG